MGSCCVVVPVRVRCAGFATALVMGLALTLIAASSAHAVDGDLVFEHSKIAPVGLLDANDEFGTAIAYLGDLDGDGGPEFAVGARGDDDVAINAGALYVLFLDTDGALLSTGKISAAGLLPLIGNDNFGRAVAFLGDMDGDGFPELAVGAPNGTGGGVASGVVWIVEINPTTGAAVGALRLANGENGFPGGVLDASDQFGVALANAGDWDGDGRPELVVGAQWDGDGGPQRGALHILYLNANGSVRQHAKISSTAGGFGAPITNFAEFGGAVTAVDDQDGDGQTDLAVGAIYQGPTGSVFLLYLDPNCGAPTPVCTVKPGSTGFLQIANGLGGFASQDVPPSRFGRSLAWLPAGSPLASDRLVVGDLDWGGFRGSSWLFELNAGQLFDAKRLSSIENWDVVLDGNDLFGVAVGSAGDLNGDGATDLAVAALWDDDAAGNAGAVYLARISSCPSITTRPKVYLDPTDEGRDPCVPLPLDGSEVLHLYIESGGAASSVPAAACTGALHPPESRRRTRTPPARPSTTWARRG